MPLKESYPDRTVLGYTVMYLREGTTCNYPPGTLLEVLYTEMNGRRDVDLITPIGVK